MNVMDIKLNFEVVELKQRLKLIEQCLNYKEIDLETANKQIKKIDNNIKKILSSIRT